MHTIYGITFITGGHEQSVQFLKTNPGHIILMHPFTGAVITVTFIVVLFC